MSSFTPLVNFETKFEEDTVTMSLRRLKRKSMMLLSPYMDNEGEGKIDEIGMLNVISDILPDHVVNFKGLVTADGTEITVKEMCDEAFFLSLQSEIISKIFEISKLTGDDAKNLQEQPSGLPEEQVPFVESASPHTRVRSGSSVSKPAAE